MKKALLALVSLLVCIPLFSATSAAKDVDSTLFAYYQWCNAHRQDPDVLLKADTLLRLATEKNDARMQCISQVFKADYYYFTQNLDSLKAWIPRVQEFSRARQQLKYYYFVWSRLILYYTKQAHYTLAQYELERYLAQACTDDFKPARADAYIQLAHIYRTKALHRLAADYYRKAIDYIEQNDLDRFALPTHYSALATMLIQLKDYTQAATVLEKGKTTINLPDQIWPLKLQEVSLYAKTGEIGKAQALLREIEENGDRPKLELFETKLNLYKNAGEYDKALSVIGPLMEAYKASGELDERYYFSVFNSRAQIYAALGNYEAAYADLTHFCKLYRQKVTDENESTLGEFATLLDVSRLDHEKLRFQEQAQAERLRRNRLMIIGLGVILTLALFFGAMQTVTNRHLKRAKRDAEKANRIKGIFIRNITHEINTPLNSIVGFTELAAAAPADDPERESYISIIQENSGYLQKLVDDVLYISDLESSEASPARSDLDVNSCCRQCIDFVRTASPGAEPEIRFQPGRPEFVACTSRILVMKVLKELLSNAVRIAPKGTVTLAYEVSDNQRSVTFSVTDTGPGVSPAEADHIFERFVKLDAFTQGLGLGLSVCELIARAMEGEIRLDTSYTTGARFLFTIPV